jgi:cytochrome oxidase Cu insertion factor (SCO1/SenC/PrrC family)
LSFGLLWIFDGILQGQASMPLGMAPNVIEPAAASSPTWVQHLDNVMATIWSYHPIAAPAAAVWVQVGIGLWLLAAPRGNWSRIAGVASVGWGLNVWIFGEAFGQVFASGQSFLFGLPGAAVLYCVAGCLVALPEDVWESARTGRRMLGAMGTFFLGMAVLQAWPGRGFWQGQANSHAVAGQLTSMLNNMDSTPQPSVTSSWVSAFAGFDAAHGWGVNLFAVLVLLALGVAFVSGRRRVVRGGLVAATVLLLADWVLVQDLGFLGGVGTDPNSMIPILVVSYAGYLALTRPALRPASNIIPLVDPARTARSPFARLALDPTFALRVAASVAAIAVVLVGSVPAAVAATDPNADPILAQAINGTPQAQSASTPPFQLIDQTGAPISSASLRGKTVALTFLDDVCTSTCPLIAQYFRQADKLLGSTAAKVELVAINANPVFIAPDYLQAFDHQENMASLANWKFLTGSSLRQLESVWSAFGNATELSPGGAMVGHSEFAAIIGPGGHLHYVLNAEPGPGTQATGSSFAVVLADTLKKVASGS